MKKDVLLSVLIREVKEEMEKEKMDMLFIYTKMYDFTEMVNGETILTLGLLNKAITVLGVTMQTEWRQTQDSLIVNTTVSYKDKTDQFLMSSTILSQPIIDDYAELIFCFANKLYGFLVEGDVEFSCVMFDIKDYYDILY